MAKLIDGKAIAQQIRNEVLDSAAELQQTHGVRPGLAVVLVGDRKDSQTYVRAKKKAAEEVGFLSVDITLDESISEAELLGEIQKLNLREDIHGILVQLPLPKHISESKVLSSILVSKDVDGFSAENIGNLAIKGGSPPLAVPCTPAGCLMLLQRSGVELAGKHAVVLGRSNIVGMPAALLLLSCDCTVTIVHSRTKNIEDEIRRADVLVAAVGKPEMVRGSWLKPGCVVIDVGINAVEDSSKKTGYRLVGDVCFDEAVSVASQITPVPGGVGPMTIAMLMRNTLNLARHSVDLPRLKLRNNESVVPPPTGRALINVQQPIVLAGARRALAAKVLGGFAAGLVCGFALFKSTSSNSSSSKQ